MLRILSRLLPAGAVVMAIPLAAWAADKVVEAACACCCPLCCP